MLSSSTVHAVQRDCSSICWQKHKETKEKEAEKFERFKQKDESRVGTLGLASKWVTYPIYVHLLFAAWD